MIAYLCPCGNFGFFEDEFVDVLAPELLAVCTACGSTQAEVQWQQLSPGAEAMVKEFLEWRKQEVRESK